MKQKPIRENCPANNYDVAREEYFCYLTNKRCSYQGKGNIKDCEQYKVFVLPRRRVDYDN